MKTGNRVFSLFINNLFNGVGAHQRVSACVHTTLLPSIYVINFMLKK
jgi:hypothetical protein